MEFFVKIFCEIFCENFFLWNFLWKNVFFENSWKIHFSFDRKSEITVMLRCLLSYRIQKKIEQNINFIAHFFTMKGFHKYTYEISLIGPNGKKIIFCNMEFFGN